MPPKARHVATDVCIGFTPSYAFWLMEVQESGHSGQLKTKNLRIERMGIACQEMHACGPADTLRRRAPVGTCYGRRIGKGPLSEHLLRRFVVMRTHRDSVAYSSLSSVMPGEFVLGSFQKHRDLPSTEDSLPIKKLSRLLLKWSLVFACVGAILILAGMAAAKYGSEFYFSAGHTAILVGMVALLYLGFLPALLGGVLWVFAKRIAKSE